MTPDIFDALKRESVRRGLMTALLAVTLVALMAFIFVRSSKDAEESSDESGRIVHTVKQVIRKVDPDFNNLSDEEELAFSDFISFVVRKLAHFSIFALLGANACALTHTLRFRRGRIPVPILFGTFYAFTDELHQYFVPGRSMELRDILIDAAGVTAGVYVVVLLNYLCRRHASKRHERENSKEHI